MVIVLAESLGLVIAEGVETPEQQAFCQAGLSTLIKGYLYSKPLPLPSSKSLHVKSSSEVAVMPVPLSRSRELIVIYPSHKTTEFCFKTVVVGFRFEYVGYPQTQET